VRRLVPIQPASGEEHHLEDLSGGPLSSVVQERCKLNNELVAGFRGYFVGPKEGVSQSREIEMVELSGMVTLAELPSTAINMAFNGFICREGILLTHSPELVDLLDWAELHRYAQR